MRDSESRDVLLLQFFKSSFVACAVDSRLAEFFLTASHLSSHFCRAQHMPRFCMCVQEDAPPRRPALDEDAEDEAEDDTFADLPKAQVQDRFSPVSKSPPKLSRHKQRSVYVVPHTMIADGKIDLERETLCV